MSAGRGKGRSPQRSAGARPAGRRASRLRVTGGSFSGRRLLVPSYGVRPTSDRVREALFARLGDFDRAQVLDLYAGSGALGIEALSRGAARVVFVERAAAVASVLAANLESLDLADRAELVRADCRTALGRLGRDARRFDLVLLDPPYDSGEAEPTLAALLEAGLLSPGGVVVVETAKRHPVPAVAGLTLLDQRDYGDTRITRWIAAGAEASEAPD